jgi:hypothetical protein
MAAEARSSQNAPGRSNAVPDASSALTFNGSPSEQSSTMELDRQFLSAVMAASPLQPRRDRHFLYKKMTPG